MWPNPQETADLVTFTEKILYGKLHFLCSAWHKLYIHKMFRGDPRCFTCYVRTIYNIWPDNCQKYQFYAVLISIPLKHAKAFTLKCTYDNFLKFMTLKTASSGNRMIWQVSMWCKKFLRYYKKLKKYLNKFLSWYKKKEVIF